ncbi:MAG: O-antigen ligase family protein [Blastocatellia bacterium]|nr:O-antigen ligase family protein [Blastocatellia bacterium]
MSSTSHFFHQRLVVFAAVLAIGGSGWLGWLAMQGAWPAVFGFAAWAAILLISGGETGKLLVWWLGTTPFLSYLTRFPMEKSIITFDRLMIGCLLLFFLRDRVNQRDATPLRLGLFEITWAVFCLFALGDLLFRPGASVFAWKTGIDGFVLPLVVFVIAKEGIQVSRLGRLPLVLFSILAVCLLPVGLYESVFHSDVMSWPGSNLVSDGMVRPNGPFAANHSYAMISVFVALVLWHWPAGTSARRWPGGPGNRVAALVALFSSALPLFRALWLTAVIVLGFPSFLNGTKRQRRALIGGVVLLLAVALVGRGVLSQTSFYQSRVANPENIYTRIATYQAAVRMFDDNWLTGVGLTRYTEAYNRVYYNEDDYNRKYPTFHGEIPRNSPHNNILSVLAELGLVPGCLYVLAHVLLVLESLVRLRSPRPELRRGGTLAGALWLAYWIPGMVLAAGYYPDVNLFFFALSGLFLGMKPPQETSFSANSDCQAAT